MGHIAMPECSISHRLEASVREGFGDSTTVLCSCCKDTGKGQKLSIADFPLIIRG